MTGIGSKEKKLNKGCLFLLKQCFRMHVRVYLITLGVSATKVIKAENYVRDSDDLLSV